MTTMRILRKVEILRDYALLARDGDMGKLVEIYFDDNQWVVRYFVVRTGHWLTGRMVLILPGAVSAIDDDNETIEFDLTRDQIEQSPTFNTTLPVSRHYEYEYYRFYGFDPYWTGDPLFATPPQLLPAKESTPSQPANPHLRSSHEVKGYAIQARDGDIGHVTDYIIEQPDWALRYIEVDTRKWLPGKHVLISPAWISRLDWEKRAVTVMLSREAIQAAPAYDPEKIISHEYQVALYKHYGMHFEQD